MLTDDQYDSIFLMQHIRARIARHWVPADQVGAQIHADKEAAARKSGNAPEKLLNSEAARRGITQAAMKIIVIGKVDAYRNDVQPRLNDVYEDYQERIVVEPDTEYTDWRMDVDAEESAAELVWLELKKTETNPERPPLTAAHLLLLENAVLSKYPPIVDAYEVEMQQIVADHG